MQLEQFMTFRQKVYFLPRFMAILLHLAERKYLKPPAIHKEILKFPEEKLLARQVMVITSTEIYYFPLEYLTITIMRYYSGQVLFGHLRMAKGYSGDNIVSCSQLTKIQLKIA